MARQKKFKFCYILEISGQTETILDVSVDRFLSETVVPLLSELLVGREAMVIRIGKTVCTDGEGKPHTCLTKIKLKQVDKRIKKR